LENIKNTPFKRIKDNSEHKRSFRFKQMYIFYESHRLFNSGFLTEVEKNNFLNKIDSDELTLNLLIQILEQFSNV